VKHKPIVPREMALRDTDDAVTYYLGEHAEAAALGFINGLEEAYHTFANIPRLVRLAMPMS
jgi:toxin ParE1/3/4